MMLLVTKLQALTGLATWKLNMPGSLGPTPLHTKVQAESLTFSVQAAMILFNPVLQDELKTTRSVFLPNNAQGCAAIDITSP